MSNKAAENFTRIIWVVTACYGNGNPHSLNGYLTTVRNFSNRTHQSRRVLSALYTTRDVQVANSGVGYIGEWRYVKKIVGIIKIYIQRMAITVERSPERFINILSHPFGYRKVGIHDGVYFTVTGCIMYQLPEA